VIYLGSVNGGIWQTTNATATTGDAGLASPQWLPVTDNLSASSIDSMDMDPTNSQIVLAGSGIYSSSVGVGTNPGHLLRTTNGGGMWQEIVDSHINGQNINGLAIRGNTILVATGTTNNQQGHVFRSTTGGALPRVVRCGDRSSSGVHDGSRLAPSG
jgi:hypothetical protein